jgi:signal transduction histidine kinase
VKFTETGKISFEVEHVPGLKNPKKEGIRFSIKDTGTGVAVDKQNIIFEAFRQADDTITRYFWYLFNNALFL